MTPSPAKLRHIAPLTRILWAFTRRTPWLPKVRSRATDLSLMARLIRHGRVRLVRDHRGPVGFIARDGVLIHALYIHPRGRRAGAGRILLEDAKRASDRLELFTPEQNRDARDFYRVQGFSEIATGQGQGNDEGLPDVLMVWQRSAIEGQTR